MPGAQPQDPAAQQDAGAQPGGASQLVASIHSGLMQLMDLLAKMPDEQQKLAQIVQDYQQFVDGLGQPSDSQGAQQQGPQGTTTPEQGAAQTQPVQ